AILDLSCTTCRFATRAARILWRLANCITDVAHRVNQRRIADLLSQSPDENFYELSVILVFMFPDAFAEFSTGEHAVGLAHEHFQQRQFACGQFNSARTAVNLVVDQV